MPERAYSPVQAYGTNYLIPSISRLRALILYASTYYAGELLHRAKL